MVREDLGEEMATQMPKEPFFVDFLRDAPELTGIGFKVCARPRVYVR